MNKDQIIKEQLTIAAWAHSLNDLSDELWFKPFGEGTWGIADVISHLISWDRFIIEKRISYLVKGKDFPKVNVNVEDVNKEASIYARSGITKEDIINKFVTQRRELVNQLYSIPTEKFTQPCPGKEDLTLAQYFTEMVNHDLHHKEQIESFLKNSN